MWTIKERNVNGAWERAKHYWREREHHLIQRPSRNGAVWEAPCPVTTVYERPLERILWDPIRHCNPYFHFFEALWMLAGRHDVQWISNFNSRMKEYSDDGVIFHGAYGYRWRRHFKVRHSNDHDQLWHVIHMLKERPHDRRVVLQMWDAESDLNPVWNAKDLPCNTNVYFYLRPTGPLGQLELSMTICNRSNDVIWGAYGANAVHMSYLLEYVAAGVGVPVGTMYQVSNSWHFYEDIADRYISGAANSCEDLYISGKLTRVPLISDFDSFDGELAVWIHNSGDEYFRNYPYRNPILNRVAAPRAALGKMGDHVDWKHACLQWLGRIEQRRQKRREKK